MLGFEAYQSKLYELLSKAYKGEHMIEYRFILDFEMKQMLNRDIPIFSLKSTEKFLEGNVIDLEDFKGYKNISCHEEIKIKFINEK
jgi:hypothetical protein